jgi:AcrR family transcriptional regulator
MDASARRRSILNAALACFAACGINDATIADIRRRARATTGTMYHFFDGKAAIVGALYLVIVREYQRDLAESLRRRTSAQTFVCGIVEHYLSWVEQRPDAARFLLDARQTGAVATVESEIAAANAETFGALHARLKQWIATGDIRRVPTDLYAALFVGPAEAFARQWLANKTPTEISRARSVLATAAWESVRGARS